MNILTLGLSLVEFTKSNLKANENNGETFIWEAAVLVFDDYVAGACNTTRFDTLYCLPPCHVSMLPHTCM
jgi:hypothetical protein